MRRFIICLITIFALSATSVYAGAGKGHSHGPVTPVSEEQALKNALSAVTSIVQKDKIDVSWADIKPADAKKKQFKNGLEWVVTFNNPKVEDKKRTLYVFLSLGGQYLGANFTGN